MTSQPRHFVQKSQHFHGINFNQKRLSFCTRVVLKTVMIRYRLQRFMNYFTISLFFNVLGPSIAN